MHSTGRKHGEVAVTCTNSADDLAPRIAPLATGGSGSTAGRFSRCACVCVGGGGGGGGGDNGPASMRPSQSDVEQGLRGVGADRVSRHTECGLRATWGTDALYPLPPA